MMARNFTRSSSGCDRVARLREHALVELEPAQLAIDVKRRVLEVRGVGVADCVSVGGRCGAVVPGAYGRSSR